jgi:hypothetical protein
MLHAGQPSDRPPRARLLVVASPIALMQRALVALRPFYEVVLVSDLPSCMRRLHAGPSFDALLLDAQALTTSCVRAYQTLSETFPALAMRSVFLCRTPGDLERLQGRGVTAVQPDCALAELVRALRRVCGDYLS